MSWRELVKRRLIRLRPNDIAPVCVIGPTRAFERVLVNLAAIFCPRQDPCKNGKAIIGGSSCFQGDLIAPG